MIDISIINSNNKNYSIKSKLLFNNNRDSIKMTILSVDEIDKNSNTSFSRIKTIYSSNTENQFNNIRYKDIFNKLVETISKKYKVVNITYY